MASQGEKVDNSKIAPPKRFLTAYNFFYMHERAKVVNPKPNNSTSTEENPLSTLNAASKPWVKKKEKRRHRKTHGKIGFVSLAKEISTKWKSLTPEERKVYNDLAQEDLARYRKELSEYKKATSANQKQDCSAAPSQQGLSKSTTKVPVKKKKTTKKQAVVKKSPVAKLDKKTVSSKPQEYTQKITNSDLVGCSSTSEKQESASPCKSSIFQPLNGTSQGGKQSLLQNSSFRKRDGVARKNEKLSSSDEDDESRSETSAEIEDIESIGVENLSNETFKSGSLDSFSTMAISVAEGTVKESSNVAVVYESNSTRLLRAFKPQYQLEGRTGFVAIKMSSDQFPELGHISRFENEIKISKYLSQCDSTRSALKQFNNEGSYGIYLEWAPGITLKEWIKSAHKDKNVSTFKRDSSRSISATCSTKDRNCFDYENAVCLAQEISKALANIHAFGVAHNKITSENIIVDTKKVSGSFSVKIIDLSLATILDKNKADTKCFENDTLSLGSVLFELFLGVVPPQITHEIDGNLNSKDGTSTKDHHLKYDCSLLFRSKVPRCISTLVVNLMNHTSKHCRYQSIANVVNDFSIMLKNRDVHLHNDGREIKEGQLNFRPGKVYGRYEHMSVIMDAFKRVCQPEGSSEMVMVYGFSGAGKSALVQQAQKPITNMGGKFLCGKYDPLRQMEPLSGIKMAFTEYFNEIIKGDSEKLNQTSKAIKEMVGSEISVLCNAIPSLCQIIPLPSEVERTKVDIMKAHHRFKFIFQRFIRAIATPAQTLILFLDDLQWADHQSLDLIESLISDSTNKSLLLIGSYRDNEVNSTHPLATRLRGLERKGVHINKIRVGDLGRDDTNELISDMIQTSPILTESLSDAVYRKTSGNVLFVLRFLFSIVDEGYLNYSLDSKKWQWNISLIEANTIADNVVELMLRKILQFPNETQNALKLLACLGNRCEEFILSSIAAGDGVGAFACTDLIGSLEVAVREGLVDHVGSNYKFAHDQIGFAAYSLIPEENRGNWHLWVGSQLWTNMTASSEKSLFVAVGQLNKGMMFINDKQQKIELAELNLQAGKKSISVSALMPASFYLKTGISLLEKNSWEEHYHLCLQLYSDYAEVQYCLGEIEAMKEILDELFLHARCLNDKLEAYFILTRSLNAQLKPAEALDVGLDVLSQLGEPMPTYSDIKAIIMVEFAKTKQMLGKKTDDELMAMKAMDDRNKIAAMRFMYTLALSSFFTNQGLFGVLVLRMLQLSLNHGICNGSAFAFASYGSLLAGIIGDIHGAYRFGNLSLRLLDIAKSLEIRQSSVFLPGVYLVVYSFIFPWVEHYGASLPKLEDAYKVGLSYGDWLFSVGCARHHCIHSLQCGEELGKVEERMREYTKALSGTKQNDAWSLHIAPFWQATLNLMEHSDNPEQLIGTIMDQERFIKGCLGARRVRLLATLYHIRSWLAYIFGNYELASRMVEERERFEVYPGACFLIANVSFFEGMISCAISHQQNNEKWKMTCHKSLVQMEKYAMCGPSNYKHRLLLLQAESSFLNGDYLSAEQSYESAFKIAGENGFVQDQALAYERASIFHMQYGKMSLATQYYGLAHDTYLKWGAKCKADQLRQHCPF